jgi:methionyl-tRNA formyltransferase
VKRLALERGLDIFQPGTLREAAAPARIAAAKPELLIVAAYGLILPPAVLGIAPGGAINIHASLLPRWRGAAPIQHALLAGDAETGITLMRMDAGLDTGPMLAQERVPIAPADDAQSLHDKLAALGARMIVQALASGPLPRGTPQPAAGVSYAPKIGKRDAIIDWSVPARDIERRIRALRPAPGAAARMRGAPLKIWRAEMQSAHGQPGTVLGAGEDGLLVACGEDSLLVTELQRAGGKRVGAGAFLRGFPVAPGERLS